MNQHTDQLPYLNEFNLSIDAAAERLMNEQSIIATEYPNIRDGEGYDDYGEPQVLFPDQFFDDSKEKIIKHLSGYQQFGIYP